MAGTLAPLALVLSPTSDTGLPLDGLTRRNGVDVAIVGLNLLGGPITIFDDRDGNGIPGAGEILTTVPNSILGAVRVNLPEGTHNLRATQNTTVTLLGLTTTTTATSLPLTVSVDNTAPTIVSVNQLDLPDPLGLLDLLGVLRYEVTFSEPVLGLTADLFQATGTLPGIHLVTLLPSLTKPNTYIVSVGLGLDGVSLDQRAGTLGIALNPSNLSGVTDLAGNGLAGADFALLAPVNIGPARETATADFNADGLGDAAFLVNDTVVVTRGTGTGALGATQTVAVAAGQNTIATGDVTGDGLVDIVTAGNGRVQILKQGTDGSFTLTNRTTTGADGALIADVNGDGYADIVVKNLANGTATVLTNSGTGTFTAGAPQGFTVRPDAFVSGDFNGDGRIDLAAINAGGTALSILTQAVNGTFARSTLTVGASAGGLAAGDLNGDGRAEIVSAGLGGTLDIRGTTAGGAVTQSSIQAGAAATDIRIGDTNGDGNADILYAGTDGNVRVVYGNGAGGFSAPTILETQAGLTALALLDINGDGRQDLALASGTTGALQVGTGIPVARLLGTVYDIVAPAPVQTVTGVRVAGDNVVNIVEATAGTVPVTGTLAGPLGAGETLAVKIGAVVTPLPDAVIASVNGVTTFRAAIPALQASGDVAVLVQRTDGATSVAVTQAVTVDLVAPTLVSVTSPDAAVTKDAVIDFTLTFSEPVAGLTAANLVLTGTAAGGLVPTVATTDGGRTYTVTVPAAAAEGTLGLTFDPAGIVDAAGNVLPGVAAPVGPTLTLDHTAPVLSLLPIAGNGILSQTDLAGGVVVAGAAVGLEIGASVTVTITNAAGTPVLTQTAPVAANGAFSLPLTAGAGTGLTDGSYAVTVSATDAAGNVAAPVLANLTVDLTADAGAPFTITAGNNGTIGLAGVAAVPLAVSGLDAGTTAVVTFTDAGNNTVTATIGLNGNATVDLSGLDGAVTSTVQLTDPAGNIAALAGPVLTVDTIAPIGVVTPTAPQGAGTVSFDVTFPEPVNGLGAADFEVVGTGSILGNVIGATPNQTGGYTVVVGNLSGAGTVGLALSAASDIVDAAGNAAILGPVAPVALDLVPPPRPIITGLVGDGGVPGGFLTADTTPTLVGTTEVGSTVTVTYEGPGEVTVTLAAIVDSTGAWTATVPTDLPDGAYAFTATAVDLAGNVSLTATPKVVTIETAPDIPFTFDVDFADGLVNGVEAANIPYTLTGLPATAILSVTFTDASGTTASALLTNGNGSLDLSGLDGIVTSALTYVPPVGAPVPLGGPGATFDTVQPAIPEILGFASASPVPTAVTNNQTPVLVGTGEPGSIVTVEVGGQLLSAEVEANGTWHIPVTTPLASGTATLTATAQDLAGNISDPSPGVEVTIDLLADAGDPILVEFAVPADRPVNAAEAAVLTGSVSGLDADATATLTYTGPGGTVTVPLENGTLTPADVSALGGTVTASVSVVDAAGNRATLPAGGFTIDAAAPAATIVADPAAIPGATSLTFTVTFPEAVANLTAEDFALTRGGTAAGTIQTVTEVDGVYTVLVDGITGTGSLSLGLSATSDIADGAGNLAVLAQAGLHLVNVPVVVQPANLPVITGITEDTGVGGDFVTRDTTPIVSGTALPNGTITLTYTDSAGASASLTTTVGGNGLWSVTLPLLGDDTYGLSAILTDGFNNVLGVSSSRPLVIDTAADTGAPVGLVVSGTADGVIDAAEARAVSYTVTGLDTDSTAVARFTIGAVVKDVPIAADGTFLVDLSGFNGAVATSLVVSDPAGNTVTVPGNAIQVATAPTALPLVGTVTDDTGLPGDGITSDNTPVLSGTAEANATVSVAVTGPNGVETLQTVATQTGAWTVPVPLLADGAYTVTASATGLSGLPSPASIPFALTIDTSADLVPLVTVQLASADINLSAGEAGAVSFELTGLDTGSSGTVVFTGGPNTVTVPVDANGIYTANLSALSGPISAQAILADVAGNTVTADLVLPVGLTVDTVAPQGAVVANLTDGAAVATFTYAVTFPETVANVTIEDFLLTGTPGLTGQITSVTGSGGAYVVTVAGLQGSGTLTLGLAPGSDIADLAGNLATLVPNVRAVTGIAPVLPVITGYTTDTGVPGDGITSDPTPTLTGIGQAGATVTVTYVAAGIAQSVSGPVADNGTWSLDIPALPDAAYSFTASLAANGTPIGTSQPLALTIDTTADGGEPTTLAVSATADGTVNAAEAAAVAFTIAGLDEGTSGIVTFTDGTLTLDVPVDANGAYTANLSAFNGTVTSTLALSDAAGNIASVTGNSIPVITVRPGAPLIGGISADTGTPGDGITSDSTPTVSGTAELGSSVVHVTYTGIAGPRVVEAPVGLDGRWTADLPTLADGAYTITATVTGPGGVESLASAPFAVTIDTVLDEAPAATLMQSANTGPLTAAEASSVDLTVAGLDPGTTGTALFTDGTRTVSVAVNGNGPITADLSTLNGNVTATLALADAAGNADTLMTGLAIVVDTVAPQGSAVADLSGGPAVATFTYTVTFPETVANVSMDDFALTGTLGATGQITSVTGTGGTYVVTVAGIQGLGTLTLGLASNSDIADLAGNLATLTPATRPVLGVAPVQPVITAYTTDTGAQGDGITSDATPTLSGIGLAGGTISISDTASPGAPPVTVEVAQNGTWSVDIPLLGDGAHSLVARLVDANGAFVGNSAPLNLLIDTIIDGDVPATLSVDPGGDQRINAAEAGAVAYVIAGLDPDVMGTVTFRDATRGTTAMDVQNGAYTVDLSGFTGTVTSVLTIRDAAGNTTTRDGTVVSVDTLAPVGTAIPSTPGASGATTFTYAVSFPEAVLAVTADDFVLTGTGDASGRITAVTTTDTGYLVTVANVAGTGTLSLGLSPTSDITDLAGNGATLSATPRAVAVAGTPTPQDPTPQDPTPQDPTPQDPTTSPVNPPTGGTSPGQGAPPSVVAPVVIGLQNDTGVPGDGITGDPAPIVAGTGTPGANVTVTYDDGTGPRTVTVPVGADGGFTATLPALADGNYSVIATGRDAAGNVLQTGQPFRVVVDTVADAGAAVSLSVEPTPDGVINAGEARDTAYRVDGLDAGSSAVVTFSDGTHTVTTTVAGDGRFAVDLAGLNGPVTSTILATDAAGNEARATGNAVILDTVGPDAPVVTGFTEDTGIVGNATTADTTPTLFGTAEAGSTVSIAYDTQGGPRTATVVTGSDGHWSLDLPPLPEGAYAFVASATDAAGNRGPASAAFGLTIDPRDSGPAGSGGGNATDDGNLAPNAVQDTIATVTHAAAVTGNVLANDSDPNAGDSLHVTAVRFAGGITVSVPAEGTTTVVGEHGTLHLAADGSYSYQAIGSSNLVVGIPYTEAFTYTVSDGKGLSSSAGLAVSLVSAAPTSEASFGFAFVDARVELKGETLVLTGPDGLLYDLNGIGTLHFTDGSIQQNDGHGVVDDVWYLSRNLDVWQAKMDADTHYETYGWHEGRDPNAYFSTLDYLGANPDVAAAGLNPLEHYVQYGEHEGRSPSAHFSADAYLSTSPDVAAAGQNALEHYLAYGRGEGRNVQDGESGRGHTGAFDPAFYLAQNPDVAEAAAQAPPLTVTPSDFAFRHYLEYGASEGRAASAQFDTGFYLTNNPDVAAAGLNPLLHYEEYGWREGRNPGPGFDTNAYLEHNPDVAAADIDPLQHFLDYGMKEGRLPA